MLGLLLVFVAVFVVVLSAVVIAILVKGNASLKAKHRAYVVSVNSVYDNHSNIIIGLQGQVEDLLAQRADGQAVIAHKDHHIAGLVEEVARATSVAENLEKDLRIKERELQQARKHAGQLFNK